VEAKLRMAAWSTLWGWAVLLLGVLCWLLSSGSYRHLLAAPFLESWRGWQIVGGGVLGLGVLVVSTWVVLVGSMWVPMTGRRWVRHAVALVVGFVWVPLALAGYWLWLHYLPLLLSLLPWLAAGALGLRLGLGGWLARRTHRDRLLTSRTIVGCGVAWLVLVVAAFVVLVGCVPSGLVPWYGLALAAALVVPLVRFAAMPVALAWNRHR
jgi:hypothetical protein